MKPPVTGTIHDALDTADAHQEAQAEPYADHFVNVELSGRPA